MNGITTLNRPPINKYSTTPREVGTWYNGKTIYEVVVTGTFPSATSGQTSSIYSISDKQLVSVTGAVYGAGNNFKVTCCLPYTTGSSTYALFFETGAGGELKINYAGGAFNNKSFSVIIRYVLK